MLTRKFAFRERKLWIRFRRQDLGWRRWGYHQDIRGIRGLTLPGVTVNYFPPGAAYDADYYIAAQNQLYRGG